MTLEEYLHTHERTRHKALPSYLKSRASQPPWIPYVQMVPNPTESATVVPKPHDARCDIRYNTIPKAASLCELSLMEVN
jgi:hypothetical protein